MSNRTIVHCPYCLAKLRMKSHVLRGKRNPCPQCQECFAVEHNALSGQYVSVLVLDEAHDAPAAARPARPRRKVIAQLAGACSHVAHWLSGGETRLRPASHQ